MPPPRPEPRPSVITAVAPELRYAGPERRQGRHAGLARVLASVLDEIDYGLILLDASGSVVHANLPAQRELDSPQGSLNITGRELRCRDGADQARLDKALGAARRQGLRSLVQLGRPDPTSLSIVPLPTALSRHSADHATLITLQRPHIGDTLSVNAYARQHGLSPRESEVLALLCAGQRAAQIAAHLAVSPATVRTHIHNLKSKTGSGSLVDLVKSVALLPPMVERLGRAAG